MAAAEAVATSADEEVVCEGEKTREERDAELYVARPCRWTSKAVSGWLGKSGEISGKTGRAVYTVRWCIAVALRGISKKMKVTAAQQDHPLSLRAAPQQCSPVGDHLDG